jgi:dnaJ domain
LNEEIILEKSNLKKWRNRISKIIAPDKNNNSKESNEATKKLNEIYDELKKYE